MSAIHSPKTLYLLVLLFLPLNSNAGTGAGWYVPSNPDAKTKTCNASQGCTLTPGSKISWYQYTTFLASHYSSYKAYKFTALIGPCKRNWKGRRLLWFALTQAYLDSATKGTCNGPSNPNPAAGGSGGSGSNTAPTFDNFTCPNFHKDDKTPVKYAAPHQLCCNPLHSTSPSSSSNTHK